MISRIIEITTGSKEKVLHNNYPCNNNITVSNVASSNHCEHCVTWG